ncbi:sensor histidine kinase [Caldimonas thermodepolymerans]|uniref:sensor histidine kinase n=1 Tax=Caldimonas thermodepolymerans TaxID=215580 RepID=UPI000E2E24D5|nr:sensor histidine kinase [Caldimonas thermodepolymerans]RDI03536.1 signal transduction histidine kinase [Caldimonas thermodepolymerans]
MKLPEWLSLRHGSLRVRLLIGALVWIALALAVAGWGLRDLFRQHTRQQLEVQLVHQLDRLSAAVNPGPQVQVDLDRMAGETRFDTPLSGLYWQVDVIPPGGAPQLGAARSRSLWDEVLALPPEGAVRLPASQGHAVLQLPFPPDRTLLAVSRPLQLPDAGAPLLRVTVAADEALLAEPVQRFTRMLWVALGLLAAGLVLAVAVQLQLALRPLNLLREQLGAVRTGVATRLEGPFPRELQPLVHEFNHVLGANADIVQRARTQAGNLAHALHTPLSILGNAAAQERSPLAQLVQEQVATAQRQVDYHLARARAAAAIRATGLRTPVRQPVEALLRTMRRLHAGRPLEFVLAGCDPELAFRGEPQDLFETLGNLLDNAGKWARRRVELQVHREGDQLCFTVDDDGPGIPPAQRERIFERGERLDEQRAGAGLGLDIVRELAQTYGGRVSAEDAPLGGLRMRLHLPAAVQA